MAGEGFMMNAIQSLKFNRSQKRTQRRERLNVNDYQSNSENIGHDPIKATPELLKEIKTKLQAENKKRKKLQIILAVLSFIIAIILIYLISQINYVGISINNF